MVGCGLCIYNLCANHTSTSGFDRIFMPCSGYFLCSAEQRAGYQISWVNLQREAKLSVWGPALALCKNTYSYRAK